MYDVLTYLESLYGISRQDPEKRLAVIGRILKSLGDPQNTIPAIHIAGTSGKGSTAYYAAALLRSAGFMVGLAVSPHVNTVRERSQVDGAPLGEDVYVSYFHEFRRLPEVVAQPLSYIEFMTIFTYWLFAKTRVDYMVIEVGMGGRLDPTNSITRNQTVRVITDIGLDHTEILGDTLAKIATEKAGIIHEKDTVTMNRQLLEVETAIRAVVDKNQADMVLTIPKKYNLPPFQQRNFHLAVVAVDKRLELDAKRPLNSGAKACAEAITIPGRFEQFSTDGVDVVLDAAHNPQKIAALVEAIRVLYPTRKVLYVVAFGENKRDSLGEMLALLLPAESLYATKFMDSYARSVNPDEIAAHAKNLGVNCNIIDDTGDAFSTAKKYAKKHDTLLVVTGSFYLIDKIRKLVVGD